MRLAQRLETARTTGRAPTYRYVALGVITHAILAIFFLTADGYGVVGAHDGQYFAALATDPLLLTTDLTEFDAVTYRAARIGMPLMAAPFAWISPEFGLTVAHLVGVGLGVWASVRLAERRGLPPALGLVFALLPGVMVSTRFLIADTLAVAAVLAGIDAWESGGVVWPWLTLGVLTRESMLLAVVGMAVFIGWRRAVVPVAVFGVWVGTLLVRFGWETSEGTVGPLFAGLIRAVRVWEASDRWDEMFGGFVLLGVCVGAVWLAWRRPGPLTWAGLAVCLVVPFLGSTAAERAIHTQRFLLLPLLALVLEWKARHASVPTGTPTKGHLTRTGAPKPPWRWS